MSDPQKNRSSRRKFLRNFALGTSGAAVVSQIAPEAAACLECIQEKWAAKDAVAPSIAGSKVAIPAELVSAPRPAMDPMKYLRAFDYGKVTDLPDGTKQREYYIVAEDTELEVAPGIKFPAWTFNGFLPGPTLRATAGDRLLIHFENKASKPHTIHLHGVHPANMDGVFETVATGERLTYDFTAEPFGVFPYHCHMMPLRKHISRGLYGTLIIDPPTPRPAATEFIMVMHGLDVDLDMENEFYAVNGVANYYAENPIDLYVGEKVRIYLSNMTEFDLVNNFHLHANMFEWYPNGTRLESSELTDTVNLCQGQRGILEFSYKFPGKYMFHAHTTEFAELGWMGFFNVKPAAEKPQTV